MYAPDLKIHTTGMRRMGPVLQSHTQFEAISTTERRDCYQIQALGNVIDVFLVTQILTHQGNAPPLVD